RPAFRSGGRNRRRSSLLSVHRRQSRNIRPGVPVEMTDQSDLDDVRDAAGRLFAWLVDSALPLWSTTGVDWISGGFVEQLTPDGRVIADVRRARLVSRQIFAFKSAGDLGRAGPADQLGRHGIDALLACRLTA